MTELTLGQRIAAKRSELGLSQSALGEQLGVSRQSVFKWESDAAIPEIDKLITLSRLFGVSLDWLLGIGDPPRTESPAQEAQGFTERERQIIEQLSKQKPVVPQWLKALAIIAVSCGAVALINSCVSLYQSSRARAQAEEVQAQAAEYVSYMESYILPQTNVVQEFTCDVTPSINMDNASARFRISPYYHEEGHSAALLVMLGEEVMVLNDCTWNGVAWETETTLAPNNGYRILFTLTDEEGREFTQELNGTLLNNLGYNLTWPTNQSVTWDNLEIQDTGFLFTDMEVKIPLPGIFRNTEGLWEKCELVLADDAGTVLDRFDLMNRSAYSAEIDFDESDVDFTTRTVELQFPEPEEGTRLHLFLNGTLSTGHTFSFPVEQWKMQSSGLTNMFHEARD